MARSREPYAWAQGLGRHVLQFTLVIAMVLVAIVVAIVLALGDTPPTNAAIHHEKSGGMDALLTGTLVMEPECITVEVDGQRHLPIFPSGEVRLEHDALLYAGVPYRTGDTISLAGGEVSAPPPAARIPVGCPTDLLWLVAP